MTDQEFTRRLGWAWLGIVILLVAGLLLVAIGIGQAVSGKVVFRLEHPTAYPAGYRGPYQLLPVLPLHLNVKLVEGSYTYGMDDIWRCTIENEVVTDLKDVPAAHQMYLRCDGARFVITGLRFDHD